MSDRLLYLSRADVEAVGLAMPDVIDLVEDAFREKGHGRVEAPPKPGIHPGDADNFIHAMPAYIQGMEAAGIKWVSGFPDNPRRGLPYISGLLILNDARTGLPLAVMDCVWITGARTGAATAVAARRLARPDSEILGVLGCGIQGRTNTAALAALFPLAQVRAYDVDHGAATAFAADVGEAHGLDVTIVGTPREAVSGCDLIVTAGPIQKSPHRTIRAGWMDPGAFASAVDFDSYWHPDALHEVDKFCTDDVPQLQAYREAGYFEDTPAVHADLAELVLEEKAGRETPEERTLTCNLGLAIDDIAVAPAVYRRAKERGLGTWLEL